MIRAGGRRLAAVLTAARSWLDTAQAAGPAAAPGPRVHWARIAPFAFLHLACLAVLWVGWSPIALAVAVGFYLLRAFFVTGFYHRYFSHRSYKTSRAAQFVFALLGNSAVQRGPLWWAAHHRRHHQLADREGDPHSPHVSGFWWSHIGWLMDPRNFPTDLARVPDLARFPELRWLNRFDSLVPALTAAGMFALGSVLERVWPASGTNGWQMLVWGFFVSTVILFHVTCLVNSAAHLIGARPFETKDQSRNSWIIALLAVGEGWHNNHHRYPTSARQGFLPREIDLTYYGLRILRGLGVIWDLSPVPDHVLATRRSRGPAARSRRDEA